MININEENDLVTIKLMRAHIIKLIWWNQQEWIDLMSKSKSILIK